MDEVVGTLGKAYQWEQIRSQSKSKSELEALEKQVEEKAGDKWSDIRKLAESNGEEHEGRRKALVLLYAHLLRLPVTDPVLQKGIYIIQFVSIQIIDSVCQNKPSYFCSFHYF